MARMHTENDDFASYAPLRGVFLSQGIFLIEYR